MMHTFIFLYINIHMMIHIADVSENRVNVFFTHQNLVFYFR